MRTSPVIDAKAAARRATNPLPRAPSVIQALAIAGATVLACLYYWHSLLGTQDSALDAARQRNEQRVSQLNEALTQQLDATLRSIDTALRHLRTIYVHHPADFDRESQELRAAYPTGMLQYLTVFDAKGYLVYASNGFKERVFIGDREHFRAHADKNDDELLISKPLVGRLEGAPIIVLSRAIRDGDRFLGVIGIPLRSDYLSNSMGLLRVDPADVLAIVRSDGTIVARSHRIEEAINTKVPADRQFLHAEPGERGVFSSASPIDKVPLLYAWRRLSPWALVAVAAINEEAELAVLYRQQAQERERTLSSIALIMLFSLGVSLLVVRINRNNDELHDNAEQQRQAASVFLHAHDGIMICDAQERIIDVNPAFTQLTGYPREEAIGQTPRMLQSQRQTPEFYRAMWRDIDHQGYWEGEVWNRRKNGELYAEWLSISTIADTNGAATRYIGVFSDITAVKTHQERLERLAHFDALTQLPNRVLLADRMAQSMAQATRTGTQIAICYLDLDGFKPVNDTFGHDAGDQVLIEVARRLKEAMRGSDTVARLGGDEFVVLVTDIEGASDYLRAVDRIGEAVAAPTPIGNQSISVSASIGVTLFPQDGADPDTLLRHADQAMYSAKQAGRNRFHMFDPRLGERARVHHERLEEIRAGLAAGQFVLYYQPKVNMRRGRVLGFEALIRWQHPTGGLLLPREFLPDVESTELEVELGRWVVAEGFRQLDAWRGLGLKQTLSINISASHLLMGQFVEELAHMLASYPSIERQAVELEMLETVALQDLEQASAVFGRCRDLGLQIALDDFGIGYSSLSYFRRLPVDTLKIDQSFVRALRDSDEDMAIVQSIVGLTKAFRRNVVAEGVEAPELGALLISIGCDVGQGNGIAAPMPAAEVAAWLQHFRPDPAWSLAGLDWRPRTVPL